MFANRLKQLRKSKPHLTQQDMANILGVAKQHTLRMNKESERLMSKYKIK